MVAEGTESGVNDFPFGINPVVAACQHFEVHHNERPQDVIEKAKANPTYANIFTQKVREAERALSGERPRKSSDW